MQVEYLYEFITIARLGSFSLAAEELCMSQSAISKHIKILEAELNIQLFDRNTRNVTISSAGKAILPYAEQIVAQNEALINKVNEVISVQNMRIKIASIPVMALYDITGTITQFQKLYPHIHLSAFESEPQDISYILASGTCDLAFLRQPYKDSPDFEYIPFCKDRLIAALPRTHGLSKEKTIELGQLREDNFLLLDKVTMLYDFFYHLCLDAGFVPKVSYTGHRPENIVDLVSKGMGVSLLMKGHTDYFKNENVVSIDLCPRVESAVYLAKVKRQKLSAPAKLFWDFVSRCSPYMQSHPAHAD